MQYFDHLEMGSGPLRVIHLESLLFVLINSIDLILGLTVSRWNQKNPQHILLLLLYLRYFVQQFSRCRRCKSYSSFLTKCRFIGCHLNIFVICGVNVSLYKCETKAPPGSYPVSTLSMNLSSYIIIHLLISTEQWLFG